MKDQERMLNSVLPQGAGAELINIKFFLGDDRNVTADQVAAETSAACLQHKLGTAPVSTMVGDRDTKKARLADFV